MEVSQPLGLSCALISMLPFPHGAIDVLVGPVSRYFCPFWFPGVPGLRGDTLAADLGWGGACSAVDPTAGWPRAPQQPGLD